MAMGNALTDIKCANVSTDRVVVPKKPKHTQQAWPFVLSVVTSVVLTTFSIIIVAIVLIMTKKRHQKGERRKETKKIITKTPIIRTPTDDPATLIAVECSFHEAQQEQGSSSESLASKDSSERLIA